MECTGSRTESGSRPFIPRRGVRLTCHRLGARGLVREARVEHSFSA
ncbi:MAG: hypothetical protein OJF55_000704 [Rhodanobacteraceae bacterium]|nr:MAG: hypothetical protein OJF55_000704 [Rhodanobacteraceae bacterium]